MLGGERTHVDSGLWTISLQRIRERFAATTGGPACVLVHFCGSRPKTPPRPPLIGGMFSGPPRVRFSVPVADDLRVCELYGDPMRVKRYKSTADDAERCICSASGLMNRILAKVRCFGDCRSWTNLVFELGWLKLLGSSFAISRSAWDGHASVELETIPLIRQLERVGVATGCERIPVRPTCWYSKIDDLAEASVAAIDILLHVAGSLCDESDPQEKSKGLKKRGPKPTHSVTQDEKLVAEYKASRLTHKEFCAKRGKPQGTIKKAQGRIRSRRQKRRKAGPSPE